MVSDRAVILAESQTITLDDLPAEISAGTAEPEARSDSSVEESQLEKIERDHIVDVLNRCQGNKAQAARMLGIHRRKLYRLIDRLGLAPDGEK
ncbi:MAG: helix-turn-helix domain-containing protein [Planctomycetales bacterium]